MAINEGVAPYPSCLCPGVSARTSTKGNDFTWRRNNSHVQYSPLVQVVKVVIQLVPAVRVVKQWLQVVRFVQVVIWYFLVLLVVASH